MNVKELKYHEGRKFSFRFQPTFQERFEVSIYKLFKIGQYSRTKEMLIITLNRILECINHIIHLELGLIIRSQYY